MRFSFFVIVLLSAFALSAKEIKVLKVTKKGDRAVIKLPRGMSVEKGMMLRLAGDEEDSEAPVMEGAAVRNYAVTAGFVYNSNSGETTTNNLTTDIDNTEIEISVDARKNFKVFEIGAIFTFSDDSTTSETTNKYTLGGSAEYNFKKNVPGQGIIPHVGGELGYGSESTETSNSAEDTATGFYYGVYGGVKYFVWPAKGFAIRADVIYKQFTQDTESSAPSTPTVTGESSQSTMGVRAGISYYF